MDELLAAVPVVEVVPPTSDGEATTEARAGAGAPARSSGIRKRTIILGVLFAFAAGAGVWWAAQRGWLDSGARRSRT